ncbi:hypothetical protein OS493_034660 [Desmophyllum pertusum]|uniref:Uncharacterized protein n=1 Tax=Desmophyllum pertusum TaxID=174260 RepID=A0A9X0D1Q7_9CNID|nr:hypothetical protein OS493_034660 [Desmophyllum pertusum]
MQSLLRRAKQDNKLQNNRDIGRRISLLFNANKWLKAVVKGDSMLFMYKMNNDCRRFRIKFNKSSARSAMENCRQFISEISPQIPVREMPVAASAESDSQMHMEDSQFVSPDSQHVTNRGTAGSISCSSTTSASASGLTLPDLANKITSSEPGRDAAQASGHIDIPQDQLSLMIRLCLTDSNFPAFVEAVEKETDQLDIFRIKPITYQSSKCF